MEELIEGMNDIIRRKKFIYEEFYSFLNGVRGIPIYSYELKRGQFFYRSRINEDSDYFYCFKDLSYPPQDSVKRFGRANRPGQNFLYLSDTFETSISEVIQENLNSTVLTTTKWLVEDDITIRLIPDFENHKMSDIVSNIEQGLNKNQIDFLKILNFYFRAVSESNTWNYALEVTSAFSNSLLAEANRQSLMNYGTLYTSVRRNQGFNLSLLPELVDNKKVVIVDVNKHIVNKLADYLIIKTEYPSDIDFSKGKIEWKNYS